jgi:hypothetical protein
MKGNIMMLGWSGWNKVIRTTSSSTNNSIGDVSDRAINLGAFHEEPLMYTISIDAHPFWVAKIEFLLQGSHFSIKLL